MDADADAGVGIVATRRPTRIRERRRQTIQANQQQQKADVNQLAEDSAWVLPPMDGKASLGEPEDENLRGKMWWLTVDDDRVQR